LLLLAKGQADETVSGAARISPGISRRAALVSEAVFAPGSLDELLRLYPKTRRSSVSPKSLIDHACVVGTL